MNIIGQIGSWITTPIGASISAIVTGFIFLAADRIIDMLLQNFYPATWFDNLAVDLDNYINKLSVKYPNTAKDLKADALATLNKAIADLQK